MRSPEELRFVHQVLADLLALENAWPQGLDADSDRQAITLIRDTLAWALRLGSSSKMTRDLNHIQEAMRRIWRSAAQQAAPVPSEEEIRHAAHLINLAVVFLAREYGMPPLCGDDFPAQAQQSHVFQLGMAQVLAWVMGQDSGPMKYHLQQIEEARLEERLTMESVPDFGQQVH
jgi:hypothetical protein